MMKTTNVTNIIAPRAKKNTRHFPLYFFPFFVYFCKFVLYYRNKSYSIICMFFCESCVSTYYYIASLLSANWWGADENCVVVKDQEDKSFLGMERCRGEKTENCTT